jgi:DNA mismatch repair protein MutS2
MDTHALRVLEFDAIRKQLAEQTACSMGRERAEAMMPSDWLPQAKARLAETTECRMLIHAKGNLPLGGVTDIRPLIRAAEIGATLDPHGLLDVLGAAAASRSLKLFLQKLALDYPIMADRASALGQFPTLEAEINGSIGINGLVLDSASPDLARIRHQRKAASSRMMERLNGILSSMRTLLQDPVIVQRGDRYCVPVKADHRGAFGGIVHDTSASGATLFMEPQAVVDLGNEIKELTIKEEQEVNRILRRLTESVGRVGAGLLVTIETLGEIDFIAARAKLAEVHNAVEPSLNQDGLTRLLSARHPLIDPKKVVPIDIELGTASNKVLLITGPNTGGKTVSLKTTGLLSLMAQCGLHVPASRAEMNVFDQVFADIGDEQSLQQSLSTFSGHISNIVRILRDLRRNALVLLDEVGAGTDPGEGASLARALLDHLREKDARVIATSHYGELKTYAFVTAGVQNASVEFDEETLSPTYRLLQGIPGSSNAFAIAGRIGIPEAILDKAREALTGTDETADLLRELEEGRRKAVAEARGAQQARVEAQMLKHRYAEELANLEALRREARQKAQEEARGLIKRAQEKLDNTLAEIRNVNTEGRQTERARQKIKDIGSDLQSAIQSRLTAEQPAPLEAAPNRPLRKGDKVQITTLGMTGELLEDPQGESPIPVQVGAMRVSVPASTLTLLGKEAKKDKAPPAPNNGGARGGGGDNGKDGDTPSFSMQKTLAITPQLTLLGQRADEAVLNVEKYLDDAYAAGLSRARLVHGKGTGALRRAVQEYLQGHPLVDDYATADPEEGGAGATVVTLRAT